MRWVLARRSAAFISVVDLADRVPELSQRDLFLLSKAGTLNAIETGEQKLHRRDTLWNSQKAAQPAGPLFSSIPEADAASPLRPMTTEERLVADYVCTGLTTDRHPLFYRRTELNQMGVKSAIDLSLFRDGQRVRTAGCVITRQRPGTAHGFIFLSLEDETGIANVIITPDLYAKNTMTVLHQRFVFVEGLLQNKENVVHVKAERIEPLQMGATNSLAYQAQFPSHDFH